MTMDVVRTLKEFEAEWREALSSCSSSALPRGGQLLHLSKPLAADVDTPPLRVDGDKKKDEGGEASVDPFDCSSAAIPSLHELVEETASKFVNEWKALDGRKIHSGVGGGPAPPAADSGPQEGSSSSSAPPKMRKRKVPTRQDTGMPRWYDHPNRVRLPLHFDYLCRGHPPTAANDDATAAASSASTTTTTATFSTTTSGGVPDDPRVQSLVDPTVTTSYRAELWNLFAQIPSAHQLQQQYVCGDSDDEDNNDDGGTNDGDGDMPASLSRMRKLAAWYLTSSHFPTTHPQRKPRKQTSKPSATEDSMCLWTRLRMSDRHEALPPWMLSSSVSPSTAENTPMATERRVATIRFECWRGPHMSPTRTVLPDSNRMSVEFLNFHTLLDFHRVLVEQSRDDLWSTTTKSRRVATSTNTEAVSGQSEGNSNDDDGHAFSPDDDHEGGFFFIEDTFYIAGSTAVAAEAYVAPIMEWLTKERKDSSDEDGITAEEPNRLARLGLRVASIDELKIAQMSTTKLEDVPMRLGIRYVHVHHGNVECSVYCVDRRLQTVPTSSDEAWRQMHPILHDVWTNPYVTPTCEACQHRTASLVTSPTCAVTDGGPRSLCGPCARQLQVPASDVELYSVYRRG